MYMIKFFLMLLMSLVVGFGFWYIIFWFITNIQNPFEWHWVTKIIYLFFAIASTGGTLEEINKD